MSECGQRASFNLGESGFKVFDDLRKSEMQGSNADAHSMELAGLRKNNKPPTDRPLLRCVLMMILRRERIARVRCNFVSAAFASIYTRKRGSGTRYVNHVESCVLRHTQIH